MSPRERARKAEAPRSVQVLSAPLAPADPAHPEALAVPEEQRYRDLHLLGLGGMGRVVAAHDARLGREVAIKSASPDALEPAALDSQLAREARIAASLDHPGIVPILDAGVGIDGRVYYTMPVVAGHTLAEVLARTRTHRERRLLLRRVLEACEAVGYAHEKGVVHRDLKPANIMLGEGGGTRVLDWGLAATFDTAHGGLVGTPAYMSPEQAQGRLSDSRTDVWSLGAILFEVWSGQPLRRSNDKFVDAATDFEREFSEIIRRRDIPTELGAILSRCLAMDPNARYSDAKALASDLENHLEGRRVVAHGYTAPELFVRLVKAWKVPLLVAVVALICLIIIVLLGLARLRDEASSAALARDEALLAGRRAEAASVETARELARTQVAQAILESGRGAREEAERLAAASLGRIESPEARGVLATWGSSDAPELLERASAPQCLNIQVHGAWVFCRESAALSAWRMENGIFASQWRRDLHVTTILASGAALHTITGNSLVSLDPDTGRTLDTAVTGCGARLKSAGENVISHDNVCLAGHRPLRVARPCESWIGVVVPDPEPQVWTAICEDGDIIRGSFDRPPETWRTTPTTLRTPGNALAGAWWGRQLAVGTANGDLLLIDPETGVIGSRLRTGFSKIVEVVADDQLLAVRSPAGEVAVFEPDEGLMRATFGGFRARALEVQADELVAVGDEYRRYRVALGTPHEFSLDSGVTSVDFDPTGALLAASSGQVIEVRQVADGSRIASLRGDGDFIKSAAFDRTTRELVAIASAVREGRPTHLMRWDGASWMREDLDNLRVSGRRIVSLASGVLLVSSYRRGIDAAIAGDPALLSVVPPSQRFAELQAASGGHFAVAIGEDDGAVWRISASPLAAELLRFEPALDKVAISLDGARVAVSGDGRITVVDGDSGRVVDAVEWPAVRFTSLAISPDLRWLAAGAADGVVRIFALTDLRLVATAKRHDEAVFSAIFSPDARLLATGSWDGRVSLHDLTRLETAASDLRREPALTR